MNYIVINDKKVFKSDPQYKEKLLHFKGDIFELDPEDFDYLINKSFMKLVEEEKKVLEEERALGLL